MSADNDGAWFLPKLYGYGAGWPIAWQGWALIGSYLAAMLIGALLVEWDPQIGGATALACFIPATAVLIIVSARKTRGGWRWRWGSLD